jgi:hypothetical protein
VIGEAARYAAITHGSHSMRELVVFGAGLFGGAIASVAGLRHRQSLLTPAIAATSGAKLAVAAVSIPTSSAHRSVSGGFDATSIGRSCAVLDSRAPPGG